MSQLNEVSIEEKETIYDIKLSYHSEKKCQNYDAIIAGIEETDGSVSVRPWGNDTFDGNSFEFNHSDPDRVIAIAQMMMAFAQMVKNEKQKPIDKNDNV